MNVPHLIGIVKAIDFNEHSESIWEINSPGKIGTVYFTDMADTKPEHLTLMGKEIKFNAIIQIAHIMKSTSNESYLKCPRHSCFAEFSGVVSSVLDRDEVILEILGEKFTVELEDDGKFIVGEQVNGRGELRIDVQGIIHQ
jgi:hypothetical protein